MKDRKSPRKPYQPPTVRTEKLYERAALACGKTASGPPPPRGRGRCRRDVRMS